MKRLMSVVIAAGLGLGLTAAGADDMKSCKGLTGAAKQKCMTEAKGHAQDAGAAGQTQNQSGQSTRPPGTNKTGHGEGTTTPGSQNTLGSQNTQGGPNTAGSPGAAPGGATGQSTGGSPRKTQ